MRKRSVEYVNGEKIVSIVVPTKNSRETINLCLESIFAMAYPHLEVIIVDGGSTDGTLQVAQKYNVNIITEWANLD